VNAVRPNVIARVERHPAGFEDSVALSELRRAAAKRWQSGDLQALPDRD
jgi:hypothetical protein